MVQMFYPADAKGGGAPFMRPEVVQNVLKAYTQNKLPGFMAWFLSKRTGICHPGVPLAADAESPSGKFPVILFTHGLFGTLDLYTTICASLAAAGYVVVAPEHEDGSALYACSENKDAGLIAYKGPPKGMPYERESVVEFRQPFLRKRVAELQTVLRGVLQDVASPVSWTDADPSHVAQLLSRIDHEDVALAGHSFGATTCMMALQEPPASWATSGEASAGGGCRFRGCLVYDLWGMPLPREVEAAPAAMQPCPLLFVNSESWFRGKEGDSSVNFCKNMRSRATAAGSSVVGPLWIDGSEHQSFSDGPNAGPGWLARAVHMSGKTHRDEVFQSIADCSRTFLRAVRQGGGSSSKPVDLVALEEELLADRLLSRHTDPLLSRL